MKHADAAQHKKEWQIVRAEKSEFEVARGTRRNHGAVRVRDELKTPSGVCSITIIIHSLIDIGYAGPLVSVIRGEKG